MNTLSRVAQVVERCEDLIWRDRSDSRPPTRCEFAAWCAADGEHSWHWRPIAEAWTETGALAVRVDVSRAVDVDGYVWKPQVTLRFPNDAGALDLDDDELLLGLGENDARALWEIVTLFGAQELGDAVWDAFEVVSAMNREAERPATAPSWSSCGGRAPRMTAEFLQVHLWRSTGCHDLPGSL